MDKGFIDLLAKSRIHQRFWGTSLSSYGAVERCSVPLARVNAIAVSVGEHKGALAVVLLL